MIIIRWHERTVIIQAVNVGAVLDQGSNNVDVALSEK